MSPHFSRLILIALIARAIAAPVALRPRLAEQAGHRGFDLWFLADEGDSPETTSPQPELTPPSSDRGLVFRVCFWPAPRHRSTPPERCRRSAKPRTMACGLLPLHHQGEPRTPSSLPGVAPKLSTDRYLHHALGQQRC